MVYWVAKAVEAVTTFTVPEPVNVPAPEITFPDAGVKVEPELTVKVPVTAKLPLPVRVLLLLTVKFL